MATIIINQIAHREACLYGQDMDAGEAYDARIDAFIDNLRECAEEAGHSLEVERGGLASRTYRVDAEDEADEQAAHDFMTRPEADFWGMY